MQFPKMLYYTYHARLFIRWSRYATRMLPCRKTFSSRLFSTHVCSSQWMLIYRNPFNLTPHLNVAQTLYLHCQSALQIPFKLNWIERGSVHCASVYACCLEWPNSKRSKSWTSLCYPLKFYRVVKSVMCSFFPPLR